MPFPYDKYPWLNFQELNLAYFIKHFREIFQQWDELYHDLTEWKETTDQDLADWKTATEAGLESWKTGLTASLETWKAQTANDISGWETATLAALDAWKTATTAVFEQIRVEAAGSASAAAASASAADTARAAAVSAQTAAEQAAAEISAELAQIRTNSDNIAKLQNTAADQWLLTKTSGGFKFIDKNNLISNGYINGNTGEFTPGTSGTGLNCCTDFIAVTGSPLYYYSRYNVYINVVEYDIGKAFITAHVYNTISTIISLDPSCKYVRVSLNSNSTGFNSAEIHDCGIKNPENKTIWRDGSAGNAGNADGINPVFILDALYSDSVTVIINRPLTTGHKYRFQYTLYNIHDGVTVGSGASRIKWDINIDTDKNYCIIPMEGAQGFTVTIFELDGSEFIPLRIDNYDYNKNVIFTRNYIEERINYVIDSVFQKKTIKLTKIGNISGAQSFCKYNGHYFSTDGNTLFEQDENFNLVESTALAVGHGNSFQLGNDGFAYVSGWNDNTIYIVNLNTKTIAGTISLPATGYTTCAIDDINKLAYIFQRPTYPTTQEHYNFIVYDYDANQIISTKKTTLKFGAMQACDFTNGRIVVLNGLGTTAIPNGYKVYNTNGDIIAELRLDALSTDEPEGVFIDRDNGDIYISVYNKSVYKIT